MPGRRSFVPVKDWTDPRHVRGYWGERFAMEWFRSLGWVIEAHRFRVGRHDIDLVVRQETLVAFVEVKTRSSTRFGTPAEAVGWRKRRAQVWAATAWVARHGRLGDRYRFDVISVTPGRSSPKIEHLADAWRP